jgi:hypothetical protein
LLDAQRVLVPEMELDAAVEHALHGRRRGVDVADRGEIDAFRHRKNVGILDHRKLAEADARLRDRVGGDQANTDFDGLVVDCVYGRYLT